MSGSAAEERLRAKVEATLRRRYPEARIVHELVLKQGGCRIDLAAVMRDRLVVAEIKSERDTLKRLGDQVRQAVKVANDVWICFAEKHIVGVRGRLAPYNYGPEKPREPPLTGMWREHLGPNPDRISELDHTHLMLEQDEGLLCWPDGRRPVLLDPRAQLDALWHEELAWICRRITGHANGTRRDLSRAILEHGTGAQIRRGMCAAFRTREFPRADAPVELTGLDRPEVAA